MLKKQLTHGQMAMFFKHLLTCLIGMEACGGALHWARKLQSMGHAVRLISPQFVKPYALRQEKQERCEMQRRSARRWVARICDSYLSRMLSNKLSWCCTMCVRGSSKHALHGPTRFADYTLEFGLIFPQSIGHIAVRVPGKLTRAAMPTLA